MWRKVLRGVGCLSYAGAVAVTFALVSYATFSLFVRGGVTPTPELSGLSEEEGDALLADQGLKLAWSGEEDRFDERVPAGHVLSQRPRAGTLVKRGSEVEVILSRGPRRIEVPEVVGKALQAAQVTLAAAGLRVGRTATVYSQEGASGLVVVQEPPAGAHAEHGAAVDLFVSRESSGETYVMPDLVRRDYDAVRRFFTARGFRLGRVSYESYDGVEPGTVVRQFPLAGHPLRQGDVISLGVVAAAGQDGAGGADTGS